MAACSFCGEKAGMMRDVCDTCQQTQREAQAAAAEQARAENAERFERETKEKLENWAGRTADYLTSGGKAFVYKYVYLQVTRLSRMTTSAPGICLRFNLQD